MKHAREADAGAAAKRSKGQVARVGEIGFAKAAFEAIQPMYQKILEMKFIEELLAGTLDRGIMAKYLVQDSLYLKQYAKVLALIAAKCTDSASFLTMSAASHKTLVVESSLHGTFLKDFGVEDASNAEASPTCLGYTNFLHAQAYKEDLPVAFASILPCYVIYNEVGKYIIRQWAGKDVEAQEKHPYRKWIELYGGADFEKATQEACAICDKLAASASVETQERMLQAYLQASRFEWMFWDSAYHQRGWPIGYDGTIA
eukprot:Tamp_12088.p1 GENE.Tamp_12088~~Tamp_12088.p1  ORF type:complete len:258 (-),score=70.32 Tamp_12088:1035-1808(-)